jgi:hypothetical protein
MNIVDTLSVCDLALGPRRSVSLAHESGERSGCHFELDIPTGFEAFERWQESPPRTQRIAKFKISKRKFSIREACCVSRGTTQLPLNFILCCAASRWQKLLPPCCTQVVLICLLLVPPSSYTGWRRISSLRGT